MSVYRETIVAGKTILQAFRATARVKTEKQKRKQKQNTTPEAVRKINLKNAVRHLTAILNNNFDQNDYHITLTYSGEPSKEEAQKNLQRFLVNMKNYCKKRELDWRWIAVTEYENHRIHHHVVCSGIDTAVINSKWKYGHVNFKALDESGNYYKLADYLIKETEKTFREKDSACRKRYTGSRTIVIPGIKKELVSERTMKADPKPLKGYYIDQDTINRYEHAIMGVECLEYIQVSLDHEPRLKRWKKGRKVKPERKYKENWSEQVKMEWPEF